MASIDKVNVGGAEYNIQPGEVVPVELGGTGADSASGARSSIGAQASAENVGYTDSSNSLTFSMSGYENGAYIISSVSDTGDNGVFAEARVNNSKVVVKAYEGSAIASGKDVTVNCGDYYSRVFVIKIS